VPSARQKFFAVRIALPAAFHISNCIDMIGYIIIKGIASRLSAFRNDGAGAYMSLLKREFSRFSGRMKACGNLRFFPNNLVCQYT